MADIIHLVIAEGTEKGIEITVPPGGAVVGRDENAEIHLSCEELSRRHCRFFFRSGRLHVQDLASANNTYLNNETVKEEPLSDHDVITVGTVKLMVMLNKISPAYDLDKLHQIPKHQHLPSEPVPQPKKESPLGPGNIIASILLLILLAFFAISLLFPPPKKTQSVISIANPSASPAATPAATPDTASTEIMLNSDSALDAFKQRVAQKLLEEDAKTASAWITEHLAPEQSRQYQAELSRMLRIVESVASINGIVADAFREKIGEVVTIHRGERTVDITPHAVYAQRIEATILEEGRERQATFEVQQLNPRDRLEWIPYPTTPQQHAMHFVLTYKAGDRVNAGMHAEKSGAMARAFRDAISTPMP